MRDSSFDIQRIHDQARTRAQSLREEAMRQFWAALTRRVRAWVHAHRSPIRQLEA